MRGISGRGYNFMVRPCAQNFLTNLRHWSNRTRIKIVAPGSVPAFCLAGSQILSFSSDMLDVLRWFPLQESISYRFLNCYGLVVRAGPCCGRSY